MHDRHAKSPYSLLASVADMWRGSLVAGSQTGPIAAWHLNYVVDGVERLIRAIVELDQFGKEPEPIRGQLLSAPGEELLPELRSLLLLGQPEWFESTNLTPERIDQLTGVVKALQAGVDVLGPSAERNEPGAVSLAELRASLS